MIDADPGRAGDEAVTDARWLGPAVLRVASWPIESLDGVRSRQLTKRIDDWIANEDEIRRSSDLLAAELYKIIPLIEERAARTAALDLKRSLHGSLEPVPDRLTDGLLKDDKVRQAIGPAIRAVAERRNLHAAERADIELDHAIELERASAALQGIVSDARFQRALCLASPSVFRQWQAAHQGSISRRSRLRLQSTLHRYLMRAVGRATPNGLWAGVALEDMTEQAIVPLQVRAAPSAIRVSPALGIFSRGLDHLNRRRPWIDELAWRCNPTLNRLNHEAWEFGTFTAGFWSVRRIAHYEQLEFLHARFSPADRPKLGDIEAALCDCFPVMAPPVARKLCEIWIDAGILWSTACLPSCFADGWQAVDAMIETLPASEQALWRQCRTSLRLIADKVEGAIDTLEARALRDLFDEARQAVIGVLGRYGAAISPNENVLVLDQKAPFRFSISRNLANQIEEKLRLYWRFDRYGLGELETRIAIADFFGGLARNTRTPLGEFLSRGGETDPAQRARSWQERVLSKASPEFTRPARAAFSRWERELEPVIDYRVHRLAIEEMPISAQALPPGSALLLLGRSDQGAILRIGGLTPEPSFFYSRFSHLFGERDAFLGWLRTTVTASAARWPELRFCEIAIRNHFSPNVTARPVVTERMIDPLDAGNGLLRRATIAPNHHGRPVLRASAGATELLIPSPRSAAYLGGLDRFASVLASISFFLGRPALLAPIPRLTREIESWHHLPRLMLDDAVISPERWTPEASLGSTLANARGAERLIQWRRFVRKAGLPDLVYTFQGRHQTESLVATDSAIAVELLGQELQSHGPSLRIQELFPAPEDFVVRDDDGCRYLGELAVPWSADAAFWQDYVDGASQDEPEERVSPPV
ncbi:hypothetical protein FXV83_00735 [Bradyrhizobium hipponense]|uniref:Lantibiotic dehydratase N-terminal domain-containing protein n=1 Tax=Bradyrhizobium hipponense TaxID=2605638 RepID=A0A5S4YXQ8_9BRAD|nr:lantibiotic dehydratase [Bradyrhizobium hipponense]TYO68391.1 hypothetical protein FXV83_00735 [Bradyrhizobium hipponense]